MPEVRHAPCVFKFMSCPVLSCPVASCRVLSDNALPNTALPYPAIPCNPMLSTFPHSFLLYFHDSTVLPLIFSSSHILSHPVRSIRIFSPLRAIELYLEDQSAIKSKIAADTKHRALLISNGTLDPNTPAPAPPAVGEGISNMIVKKAADEYKEVLTGNNAQHCDNFKSDVTV